MKPFRVGGFWVATALSAALVAPAFADDPAGESAAGRQQQVTAFQATSEADMQDMRHRHLWLAYGALWAIAFAFIWRTTRRQQGAERALKELESRLDAWERERG